MLLAYGLPKETVTDIMMLYKNMKEAFLSPDGDMDIFKIVAEVLQGDILTPYLFIICWDYILWMLVDLIKENGFIQKKSKKQKIPCRNYNRHRLYSWSSASCKYTISNQIRSACQEQAAGGIRHHVSANETELMF